MDSDGRLGVWPPAAGLYNILGILGDTEKIIKQNVIFSESHAGMNISTIQGQTIAVLSVQINSSDGVDPVGVGVQVLGTAAATTTVTGGLGAIASVPAGTYAVRFSTSGLTDLTVSAVVLGASTTKLLDNITLTLIIAALHRCPVSKKDDDSNNNLG